MGGLCFQTTKFSTSWETAEESADAGTRKPINVHFFFQMPPSVCKKGSPGPCTYSSNQAMETRLSKCLARARRSADLDAALPLGGVGAPARVAVAHPPRGDPEVRLRLLGLGQGLLPAARRMQRLDAPLDGIDVKLELLTGDAIAGQPLDGLGRRDDAVVPQLQAGRNGWRAVDGDKNMAAK